MYEIQKSADESLPLIGDDAIAAAEARIENVRKIKTLALRVTNQRDWVDLGGAPYLQESGVMKIAQLFRVSFGQMRVEERRVKRGERDVLQYIATLTAHYGDQSLEIEGIASSDDRFFGQRDGQHRSLDDIDLDSIRKKAVTNAQSRGLKKILGLGGMTWDDVQAARVDRSRMAGVAYGDGTRGGKKRGRQAERQATGEDGGSIKAQLKLRRRGDDVFFQGADGRWNILPDCDLCQTCGSPCDFGWVTDRPDGTSIIECYQCAGMPRIIGIGPVPKDE